MGRIGKVSYEELSCPHTGTASPSLSVSFPQFYLEFHKSSSCADLRKKHNQSLFSMASLVVLAAASCQVASLALIALSAFTTSWLLRNASLSNTSVLKGDNYGLWVFCTAAESESSPPLCEYISGFPEWWNASRSFIVMSSVVSLMALIAYFTSAFNFFPGERGRTTFIGATSSFAECVFLVISLCIFHSRSHDTYEAFYVGWSYYTAWAAFSCNMGSLFSVFIFFFCRPDPKRDKQPETTLLNKSSTQDEGKEPPNDIATMSPLFDKRNSELRPGPSQYQIILTSENGSVRTGIAHSKTSPEGYALSSLYSLSQQPKPSSSLDNYQMGMVQTATLSV